MPTITHDVVIIGSGAAGLTAAINLAQDRKVVVLAKGLNWKIISIPMSVLMTEIKPMNISSQWWMKMMVINQGDHQINHQKVDILRKIIDISLFSPTNNFPQSKKTSYLINISDRFSFIQFYFSWVYLSMWLLSCLSSSTRTTEMLNWVLSSERKNVIIFLSWCWCARGKQWHCLSVIDWF